MVDKKSTRSLDSQGREVDDSGIFVRARVPCNSAIAFAVHDARNHLLLMLSGIDYLRSLADEGGAGPDVFSELDSMRNSGRQIALMLGEVLACARHDAQEVVDGSQDLGQIVADAVASLQGGWAREKSLTIQVSGDPRTVHVADHRMLRRVVDNLLLWAIERAPLRSAVRLAWGLDRDHAFVRISGRSSQPLRVVSGAESAPDAESDLACLGIDFCRSVANALGGQVEVRDQDQVRTLTLSIPVRGQTAGETQAGAC